MAVQRTVDKWKKKKWYSILSSKVFGEKEIGTTVADEDEKLVGRTIKVNLRELARQSRKQHISVVFKINKVQGTNAYTEAFGLEVNPSSIKRIVRRRSSKVDIVQDAETKDGFRARVKSAVICARKIPRNKEVQVRKKTEEEIANIAKKNTFEQVLEEIAFGDKFTSITKPLNKICQVKRLEVMKVSRR